MSRLWRWRRSREQRGSAELLVSHQEDKMHFDIFCNTGGAFDIFVQLWITTMSFFRILPPYGVPRAGRAAEDGDGLLGRLRGDARLHRQLRLHISWLDRQLPPSSPLSLTHLDEKSSIRPQVLLGSTLLHRNNPRYPPPPKSLRSCCSKQLYTPCIIIGMWYWLLMCFIESQTVHTCCPLFFVLGAFFWQLNVKISKKEYEVGIFSQLCIMIRLVVGFWDFWELFSWLRYSTSRFYASKVFSSILA